MLIKSIAFVILIGTIWGSAWLLHTDASDNNLTLRNLRTDRILQYEPLLSIDKGRGHFNTMGGDSEREAILKAAQQIREATPQEPKVLQVRELERK